MVHHKRAHAVQISDCGCVRPQHARVPADAHARTHAHAHRGNMIRKAPQTCVIGAGMVVVGVGVGDGLGDGGAVGGGLGGGGVVGGGVVGAWHFLLKIHPLHSNPGWQFVSEVQPPPMPPCCTEAAPIHAWAQGQANRADNKWWCQHCCFEPLPSLKLKRKHTRTRTRTHTYARTRAHTYARTHAHTYARAQIYSCRPKDWNMRPMTCAVKHGLRMEWPRSYRQARTCRSFRLCQMSNKGTVGVCTCSCRSLRR